MLELSLQLLLALFSPSTSLPLSGSAASFAADHSLIPGLRPGE